MFAHNRYVNQKINRFKTFLPQSGKNPLTRMPQRVIFSGEAMPQSGKKRFETDNHWPRRGRKDEKK